MITLYRESNLPTSGYPKKIWDWVIAQGKTPILLWHRTKESQSENGLRPEFELRIKDDIINYCILGVGWRIEKMLQVQTFNDVIRDSDWFSDTRWFGFDAGDRL